MPTYLTYVKPSNPPLPRIVRRAYVAHMPTSSDKPYTDIGSRLRWHRSLMKMDQTDYVAPLKSVKRSAYSNWESGSSRLSLNGAIEVCETYGLSLDFLYFGNADTLPLALRNEWTSKS